MNASKSQAAAVVFALLAGAACSGEPNSALGGSAGSSAAGSTAGGAASGATSGAAAGAAGLATAGNGAGGSASGGVGAISGSGGSASSSSGGSAGSAGTGGASTVTPKQKVLAWFAEISGKKTMAGQHNREPNNEPAKWTNAIHETTGKYPGLWSGDFLFQQDNIDDRSAMIAEAKQQWQAGAVVNIMWHACPPNQGEACAWDGGLLSHLSDEQWSDLTTDGGGLNLVWKARMDAIAVYLQELEDAGVAPLFRPIHEMNQGAFWWGGRSGPDGTRKLYQLTHDYLVQTKGLANLIWVWDVQDLSWDFAEYDPGDEYWEIAALDVYAGGFTTQKYEAMLAVAGDKPIAIGECQRLPTSAELAAQPRWTFFMAWAELAFEHNSEGEIAAVYSASNVLTRGDLPGW